MRILIAEDDLASRLTLAGVLKNWGYDPVVVSDGLAAWETLRETGGPRLALLDWMMPELDGPEVVRRVRTLQKADRPLYVIMLTARSDKADIIAGLEAGANDYLAKPFDPGELRARVDVGRRVVEMQTSLSVKILELQQAIAQIKTLQGILPICMHCKQIRNDQGYWNQVESYISQHSDAKFSHGVCPQCMAKHYPEFREEDDESSAKGPA